MASYGQLGQWEPGRTSRFLVERERERILFLVCFFFFSPRFLISFWLLEGMVGGGLGEEDPWKLPLSVDHLSLVDRLFTPCHIASTSQPPSIPSIKRPPHLVRLQGRLPFALIPPTFQTFTRFSLLASLSYLLSLSLS